ncbi:MAG: protein arginine kinase [Firmicutes bacterium]|nr:protein arginine kinase [Bacillota bacterium]
MIKWLKGDATDKDVVISSRVRLARNLENIKFPNIMDSEQSMEVIKKVKEAVYDNDMGDFSFYSLKDLNEIDKKVLVEKHLISPGLLETPNKSAFLLRNDYKSTIMINEEDHIRMQVLLPGLDLEKGFDLCNKEDDMLENNLKFAFDEKLGYLTSCPTNVGTGLRASVMLHLPALVMTGQVNRVLQAVNQVGLTVRGLYGEGTDALGNLFQISNQTTLGKSEEEIIKKLKNIVLQIISKERMSRKGLLNSKKLEIEDKAFRSLGILKNARILTSKEAMKLLSNVRLAIAMDIIKKLDINTINNLMISIQPASIQKKLNKELTPKDRDIKRADIIREALIN